MNLHGRAVQTHGFNPDPQNLLFLKTFEDPLQNTSLGPTVHPRVDGVPITKPFGKGSPLTTLLSDEQNGVQNHEVVDADIAPLNRQKRLNQRKLLASNLHRKIIP